MQTETERNQKQKITRLLPRIYTLSVYTNVYIETEAHMNNPLARHILAHSMA